MNEKSTCRSSRKTQQGEEEKLESGGKRKKTFRVKFSAQKTVASFKDFRILYGPRLQELENGCIIWTASKCSGGYGTINWNGICVPVHRAVFIISSGLTLSRKDMVCHNCDNTLCCNPDHLFLGNQSDNMQDMLRKGRKKYDWMIGRPFAHPAKLTESQALEIRKRLLLGENYVILSEEYRVSKLSIANIRDRRTWREICDL